MVQSRLFKLKEYLERAGWELLDEDTAFLVVDDKIEWHLLNRKTLDKELFTFYLFDVLGKRTNKLSDILYVIRNKDNVKLYFDKKDTNWERRFKEFVYTMK